MQSVKLQSLFSYFSLDASRNASSAGIRGAIQTDVVVDKSPRLWRVILPVALPLMIGSVKYHSLEGLGSASMSAECCPQTAAGHACHPGIGALLPRYPRTCCASRLFLTISPDPWSPFQGAGRLLDVLDRPGLQRLLTHLANLLDHAPLCGIRQRHIACCVLDELQQTFDMILQAGMPIQLLDQPVVMPAAQVSS